MKWTMVLCLSTLGLVALGTVRAQEEPRSVESLLEEHMGYFVRDGGNWIADNPGYEPGESGIKQSGYAYRWTFNNAAVENTMFGITESGERREFARAIFVWNAKAGKVEQFIFGATGGVGHGFEDPKGDGVIEDEFVWTNGRGEDVTFKDWVKITGPDSFDNRTYIKNDAGEWEVQANSERRYARVKN